VKVSDFDYDLPAEAIAQQPCRPRDASRLMAVSGRNAPPSHHRFRDLPGLLRPGDLLVFNDTRVIPARLTGRKPTGGGVELFLLRPAGENRAGEEWNCLIRSSRKPAMGTVLQMGQSLEARILAREGETWRVLLEHPAERPTDVVSRIGTMPLPPYIRRGENDPRQSDDRRDYQTVYAREPGAVAAPTAGLHFTRRLLGEIEAAGVRTARVTLHVGIGTFQPVRVEDARDHVMHSERYEVPAAAAEAVARTRSAGGRIVAVGTTVVRTLEGTADGSGGIGAGSGECDLFIRPGYRFRVVDAMITNFHLPRSTLLMMVSAFAGRKRMLKAYRVALEAGYRFYSYGDAMLLEP
jgi:S-adenosylmethionine:tRNA ribosyltransferase-isomerase